MASALLLKLWPPLPPPPLPPPPRRPLPTRATRLQTWRHLRYHILMLALLLCSRAHTSPPTAFWAPRRAHSISTASYHSLSVASHRTPAAIVQRWHRVRRTA